MSCTPADAAQWELLFRGEEVFWKTAGAIRDAGYGSVLSLIQEAATAQSPVPLLTREGGPGSKFPCLFLGLFSFAPHFHDSGFEPPQ